MNEEAQEISQKYNHPPSRENYFLSNHHQSDEEKNKKFIDKTMKGYNQLYKFS